MKKSTARKVFVVSVLVLLTSVAFVPSITASRDIVESDEFKSNLVEITVEVGNREHSVLLTPDRAFELENLIARTKNRLEAAVTMEETAQIFDKTVVSLYEQGMLPANMNIEAVQRLVKGKNQLFRIGNVLDGFGSRSIGMIDDDENRFCLISGIQMLLYLFL